LKAGNEMKGYINKTKTFILNKVMRRYRHLHQVNYQNQGILNFIDVGSTGGLPEPWHSRANLIKYLLNFEPNEEELTHGPNFMTYNTALWESEATLPFYIYKGLNGTGSSLFKQNFQYVKSNFDALKERGPALLAETWFDRSELVQTNQLKCRALDELLKSNFLPPNSTS
jgi:hypothetical protein